MTRTPHSPIDSIGVGRITGGAGAGERTRTADFLLGKQTFYQLNYTRPWFLSARVYRSTRWLASLAIALVVALGVIMPVHAADAPQQYLKTVSFTASTFTRGYSFTDETTGLRVMVAPQTFTAPATLVVERFSSIDPATVGKYERKSDLIRFTVTTSDGSPLQVPITVEFPVPSPQFLPAVGKWHAETGSWEELGSTYLPGGTRIRTADIEPTFTLALFQLPGVQLGRATYYGTYRRTTNLTMVAASNHFPAGTALRVTNLENGKTVTVKVVDTGGFRYPTVIDLSTPAFAKIQPTWKGIATVRVEKATPWNAPPVEPEVPVESNVPPPTSDGADPPTTAATASIVVDVASGQKLVGKKTTTPMPIASLTKLMTAAVFLDTRPDLTAVVDYNTADNTTCSCLHLAAGEAITLKDLLMATLVQSANNAALSLVRATGLTKDEFVQRMNEKARALGLRNTSYVDPTGLEAGNVSTVEDLAVLGRVLPETYPSMRRAMGSAAYSFKSKNDRCLTAYQKKDGCRHSFVSTNKLFGQTSFTIVAGKTGFIDEARHTFLLRAKDAGGHEVVLVFLRVPNRTVTFEHAESLVDWVFAHYHWS